MAYKTPDYTKIDQVDELGMEFYAPSITIAVVAILVIAIAVTGCEPPD
jgi:hypothetical protein